MIPFKEKFRPVQINQELCLRCERCLRICNAKAIYFELGVRLVDYNKCRACLNCVQVYPRNAIEVTSVNPDQVVSIKIDYEKCSICEQCLDENGEFCPKNLFYKDKVKDKQSQEIEGTRFKFKEIAKCQGCLRCATLCPEKALKPVKFEV